MGLCACYSTPLLKGLAYQQRACIAIGSTLRLGIKPADGETEDQIKEKMWNILVKIWDSTRKDYKIDKSEFPKRGQLVGGQFGQNGQKLHENDKINIFGSKEWGRGACGGQANFSGSGGIPPIPAPLGETLKIPQIRDQKPKSSQALFASKLTLLE